MIYRWLLVFGMIFLNRIGWRLRIAAVLMNRQGASSREKTGFTFDLELAVDQKIATNHNFLPRLQSAVHWKVIASAWSYCDFRWNVFASRLFDIHDLAQTTVENRRHRHRDHFQRIGCAAWLTGYEFKTHCTYWTFA